MEKKTELSYCEKTTLAHSLSIKYHSCLYSLSDLISKEGGSGKKFDSIHLALNLDEVEALVSKAQRRDKRKTPDLAFAAREGERPKMVVVECKFNAIQVRNISVGDIEQKFKSARAILTNETPVYYKKYILLKDKNFQQLKSRLKRKLLNKPNFVVMSEEEIYQSFFSN